MTNCSFIDNKLKLIKGDTLSLTISINNVDADVIDKIYFTCAQQNLKQEFVLQDNQFILNIGPERTSLLKEITSDYDVTIVFKNGETITSIYREGFIVLAKPNSLDIYDENPYVVIKVKELPVADALNKNRIVIYNDKAYICVEKEDELITIKYEWKKILTEKDVENKINEVIGNVIEEEY